MKVLKTVNRIQRHYCNHPDTKKLLFFNFINLLINSHLIFSNALYCYITLTKDIKNSYVNENTIQNLIAKIVTSHYSMKMQRKFVEVRHNLNINYVIKIIRLSGLYFSSDDWRLSPEPKTKMYRRSTESPFIIPLVYLVFFDKNFMLFHSKICIFNLHFEHLFIYLHFI